MSVVCGEETDESGERPSKTRIICVISDLCKFIFKHQHVVKSHITLKELASLFKLLIYDGVFKKSFKLNLNIGD